MSLRPIQIFHTSSRYGAPFSENQIASGEGCEINYVAPVKVAYFLRSQNVSCQTSVAETVESVPVGPESDKGDHRIHKTREGTNNANIEDRNRAVFHAQGIRHPHDYQDARKHRRRQVQLVLVQEEQRHTTYYSNKKNDRSSHGLLRMLLLFQCASP